MSNSGLYLITVQVQAACAALLPYPRTAWSFSKGNQVITTGNGGGNESLGGMFSAGAGKYTLDLDVHDDGSCLNAASPRLIIAAFEYEHPEVDKNLIHAFFLSLLLAVTGFNLFIHSYRARRHEELACSLTEPRTATAPNRRRFMSARGRCHQTPKNTPGLFNKSQRTRSPETKAIIRVAVPESILVWPDRVIHLSFCVDADLRRSVLSIGSKRLAHPSHQAGDRSQGTTGRRAVAGPSGVCWTRRGSKSLHRVAPCSLGRLRHSIAESACRSAADLACVCRGRAGYRMAVCCESHRRDSRFTRRSGLAHV